MDVRRSALKRSRGEFERGRRRTGGGRLQAALDGSALKCFSSVSSLLLGPGSQLGHPQLVGGENTLPEVLSGLTGLSVLRCSKLLPLCKTLRCIASFHRESCSALARRDNLFHAL